jgi:hypothetical protein
LCVLTFVLEYGGFPLILRQGGLNRHTHMQNARGHRSSNSILPASDLISSVLGENARSSKFAKVLSAMCAHRSTSTRVLNSSRQASYTSAPASKMRPMQTTNFYAMRSKSRRLSIPGASKNNSPTRLGSQLGRRAELSPPSFSGSLAAASSL